VTGRKPRKMSRFGKRRDRFGTTFRCNRLRLRH